MQINQLSFASYTLTVSADLLAGQTITSLSGCTATIGGAALALPHLLVIGEVLSVTHTAGAALSGIVLTPDAAGPAARLSATAGQVPGVRGNGGGVGQFIQGATTLTLSWTSGRLTVAEAIVIELETPLTGSVTALEVRDAAETLLASGVGLASVADGLLSVAFRNPANLPPGAYTLTVTLASNTRAVLNTNPVYFGGATAFSVDGSSGLAPALRLLGGPGTILGALSPLGMRVVSAPSSAPIWAENAFEIVSTSGATPYLRFRQDGTDYTLPFVAPVGGQES